MNNPIIKLSTLLMLSALLAACGDDGEKPKAARLRQKLGKGGAKLTGGAKLGGGAARAH